jgi:5'-AMP-activated protein kinase regulatory beta subunit
MGQQPTKDDNGQKYIDYAPGVPDEKEEKRKTVPIMFKYPYGGRKVCLTGSFNKWKEQIPMNLIPDEKEPSFVVILNIPVGTHSYKFVVDDVFKIDQNQPKRLDSNGNLNNYIVVSEQEPEQQKKPIPNDKIFSEEDDNDEPWGQIERKFTETKKNPPQLPPHLRYTPLNSSAIKEDLSHDPTVVPSPLMVTLGHCYFLQTDVSEAIGITTRYREKYSTVVLYKPKQEI